ncbi:hypothetical protein CRYUN_Cryun13aG0122500 [Craigia yunnanensis]
MDASKMEDELQKHTDGKNFSSLVESIGSQGSSSSKGDNESNSGVDCEIHWEDLYVGEEVGQGSYAVVYHGIWNGSDFAMKVFFSGEYKESTLLDYKKEARGMNYLHHRNPPIVHRDLKSSNLLVDRNWNVKVGDFGLSRWKNGTFLTTKSGRGTVMIPSSSSSPMDGAPELLRNEPSNEKSDVFSFGVILWELMTVSIPWNNLNSLQIVGVVGFMDRRLDLPEGLDPQVASIIRDCWLSDPENRPSFEDIINRMTGIVPKSATGLARRSLES